MDKRVIEPGGGVIGKDLRPAPDYVSMVPEIRLQETASHSTHTHTRTYIHAPSSSTEQALLVQVPGRTVSIICFI